MRISISVAAAFFAFAALAERQPFERYQSVVDRQMFGQPPPGFDPTRPPELVTKSEQRELTREQEVLKSSIHFSVINVTPEGDTAVGFTDNSDPKSPVHYYLKVGETRNGWKVVEADPVKAVMKIVKDDIEVSLELGANSAKNNQATARAGAQGQAAAGVAAGTRSGLLGGGLLGGRRPFGGGASGSEGVSRLGSLRERRAAKEQERQAAAEKERAEQAAREAQHAAEREEQRKELQQLKEELRAQRDAAEKEKAEREAAEMARSSQNNGQVNANAGDDN